jgi:hypothetical protein
MQKSKKKSTRRSKQATSAQTRKSKLHIPDKPISREVKTRRPKGSVSVPIETVGLMFTNFSLMLDPGFVYITNLIRTAGKDDAEMDRIRPELQLAGLKACDRGAEFASRAYIVGSFYKMHGASLFVSLAYYVIRSDFEKKREPIGRSAITKMNNEIMSLIWNIAEYFPFMRTRIEREKEKDGESFKAWQRDMRRIAIEHYEATIANEGKAQMIKADIFRYLTELFGLLDEEGLEGK